jgi:hypothetical protein
LFSELDKEHNPVAKILPFRRFTIDIENLDDSTTKLEEEECQQDIIKNNEDANEPLVPPKGNYFIINRILCSHISKKFTANFGGTLPAPKPEEEDNVLFASDSEEEDVMDENEAAEGDIVYLAQQDNVATNAFEPRTPQPRSPSEIQDKKSDSEEDSVPEPTTPPADNDGEDFVHSSLVNMDAFVAPSPSVTPNPMRLSISSQYLAKSPQRLPSVPVLNLEEESNKKVEEVNTAKEKSPCKPIEENKDEEAMLKLKQRQEEMQKAVEKTRQRLAQLGILVNTKTLPNEGNTNNLGTAPMVSGETSKSSLPSQEPKEKEPERKAEPIVQEKQPSPKKEDKVEIKDIVSKKETAEIVREVDSKIEKPIKESQSEDKNIEEVSIGMKMDIKLPGIIGFDRKIKEAWKERRKCCSSIRANRNHSRDHSSTRKQRIGNKGS